MSRERYGDLVARPRIHQVNLVVEDVRTSRTFYARLGLDFVDEADPVWAEHHAWAPQNGGSGCDLDLDSTVFVTKWNSGWSGGTGAVIGIRVDSREAVDEIVGVLEADGALVQQRPYDAFWGARYAVVSDPDGNAVGIMSPVDLAARSEPPAPA
jgi:catechol 2,3-dioxygenase-like lactoylglutathione lyase family enzyme